ncbi:MAG: hypothetical protein KGZ40_09135 [Clostridiales bacterium]|nr:hypothetical protein [Clostridiales bacterium]
MTTSRLGRFEGAPRFGPWLPRRRLIDAFERLQPSGIFVCAPSGYGKTYLAAQYAHMNEFDAVIWVSCGSRALTGGAVLSQLISATIDHSKSRFPAKFALPPMQSPASDLLVILRDAFRHGWISQNTCFVLDDLCLAGAGAEISLLLHLVEQESEDSVLLVTSRGDDRMSGEGGSGLGSGFFEVGIADLRMTQEESMALVGLLVGSDEHDAQLEQVARQGMGHVALLSVLAKRLALGSVGRPRGDTDLSALLLRLADHQSGASTHELLYALALMGNLSSAESKKLGLELDLGCAEAISDRIPLVTVVATGLGGSFVLTAHALAQEVFGSRRFRSLLNSVTDARIRDGCVSLLEARGDFDRVIELLFLDQSTERCLDWLEVNGSAMVRNGLRLPLKAALDAISMELLVTRPSLLLLSAEIDLDTYDRQASLVKATAAQGIAECEGDLQASAQALMLIARNYMDDSSPLRAAETFEKLLSLPETAVSRELEATAVAFMTTFSALLLDESAYTAALTRARERLDDMASCPETTARLLSQIGTASFLMGNIFEARVHLQQAYALSGVSTGLRAMIVGNYATMLAETGSAEYALEVINEALEITRDCGLDLCHATYSAAMGTIQFGLTGESRYLEFSAQSAARLAAAGDRVAEVLVRLQRVMMLRAQDRVSEAVVEIERSLERDVTSESPYLRCFVDTELAACLLCIDDLVEAEARTVRTREICTQERGAQHLLRAELVLAEIARRKGMMDEALVCVSRQKDYLLSGNANWLVGMYARSFPHLLGMIASVLGPDRIPAHMLKMLVGHHIEDSLSAAREHLEEDAWRVLARRVLGDGESQARIEALATAPICRVRLFGGFELTVGSRRVSEREWAKRKARLLFATLVLKEGRETPREQLYEHLWPEMDETSSRNNFYVIWSSMKAVLSPGLGKSTPCPYMSSTGGVCRSNPDLVRSDTQEFDELYREARKARGDGDVEGAVSAFERLAEIYRGELLPGDIYEEWFVEDRDRYRHDFGDAMLAAGDMLAAKGDSAGASRLLRKAIGADPWREDLYQAILRLQIAAGQRSAAVETYFSCRSRLVEDLGLDPSAETVRLYEQVLSMEDCATEGEFR